MALPLRRHDLVWLSRAGWDHLLDGAGDAEELACLGHWCEHRLPLVVGRQDPRCPELALGLAAPLAWSRRKIALRVPQACVLYHDAFPRAVEAARLLPVPLRPRWAELNAMLAAAEVHPRVHGSYGWQRLTGLRYLTPASDVDLLLPVAGADAADAAAQRLDAFQWAGPRIDGELIFADGSAVAWREWLQWRRGAVDRILVKRLHGVVLEQGVDWLGSRKAVAA
jgi:phosphoribosyl-dephospho-CoA transferase